MENNKNFSKFEVDLICQFCNGAEGIFELSSPYLNSNELEIWFCCDKCYENKMPSETFFQLNKLNCKKAVQK